MPDVHALLSASSAERWINCPPSARLTENMPDTESPHAAEGTLAHSLAELKVRKKFPKWTVIPIHILTISLKPLTAITGSSHMLLPKSDWIIQHMFPAVSAPATA